VTVPGRLIVLAAAASLNGQVVATAQKQIVVISPAAYPRAVFVCPRNVWVPGYMPITTPDFRINTGEYRTPGHTVVETISPLANGWKVRRADGSEGIQLTDGTLFSTVEVDK